MNKVIHGDCLQVMPTLPDKSVDMVLCDLPYGTTACKWDAVIPFEPLWVQYNRLIKDNGAIVLTASQPFTTDIINSNRKQFRYEWIWHKNQPTGFSSCYKKPMKIHENVLVFYDVFPVYNYIKEERDASEDSLNRYNYKMSLGTGRGDSHNRPKRQSPIISDVNKRFPTTVKYFKNVPRAKASHPTQKPVALFEYLIKTYTNEGETVLDNCAGSGTTAIACINTNRDYVLIEKEKEYIDIINKRIKEHEQQQTIFGGEPHIL